MNHIQIVKSLANGMTVGEIAEAESISRRTLEKKIEGLRKKHGSVNIVHLVAVYSAKGWIYVFS